MKLYQYFSPGKNQNRQVRPDSQRAGPIRRPGMPRRHHKLPRPGLPFRSVVDNPGTARAPRSGVERADLHRYGLRRARHPLLPAGEVRILAGADRDGIGACLRLPWGNPKTPGDGRVPAQPLQHGRRRRCGQPNGRPGSERCQARVSVTGRGCSHHSTLRPGLAPVHPIPANPRGTV